VSERADSLLLYGDTGSSKTVQIGELAKWEFARSGRVTRLLSADSGWDPVEDLVVRPDHPFGTMTPSGPVSIEAWNISYLLHPFPVLIKLSEGASAPRMDPAGTKSLVNAPKFKDGRLLSDDGSREVGQVAVEGLSTLSGMLMQDHIRTLRKIAEDIVGDFADRVGSVGMDGKLIEQEFKFGKSGRAHYGHVQDFVLLDLVPRFATLPVGRVIWTAHEAKGTDDVTGIKDSVLGPATIGKAAVARTAMKFGDTFHLVTVTSAAPDPKTRQNNLVTEFRAYYQNHPDEVLNRMLWPAKLSLPLDRVEELKKRFPGGFVPLGLKDGINRYMEFKLGE
jgi:hypothetical protein